tara:strand:- start:794 stop:1312 length:519 start_codon:yes stop_codon:yes gene_type:complete
MALKRTRSKRKSYHKKHNKRKTHKRKLHKKRSKRKSHKRKSHKKHHKRHHKKRTYKKICKCCVKRKCPCTKRKFRGGGNCTKTDMGERFTGYAYNNHEADLRSTSSQNHIPLHGGGLGQALIDFGGSGLVTAGRNLVNLGTNVVRQYKGDVDVPSADPINQNIDGRSRHNIE